MTDIIIIDSDTDSDAPPQKKFKADDAASTMVPKTRPFEGVSSSSSSPSPSPSPSPSSSSSSSGNVSRPTGNGMPNFGIEDKDNDSTEPREVLPQNANGTGAIGYSEAQSTGADNYQSEDESSELGVTEDDSQKSADSDFFLTPASPEEIAKTRRYLKERGRFQFLQKYLPASASSQDIIQIVLKLGFIPKSLNFDDIDLQECVQILNRAMEKVRSKRDRLDDVSTYHDVIRLIRESKKILIITGAGISTSLGIPDFRSSKGFYSMVQHLGLSDPQEVFDLEIFHADPSLFYSIAHMILPPGHSFTPLHSFIQLLQSKDKLLRNYTQNIDNIESYAGIKPEKLIQCHGSFARATCISCGYNVPGESIFPDIRKRELPMCPRCDKTRKRLLQKEDTYIAESFGVFKPDITFFGEGLPQRFHDQIGDDIANCDLLISVGTSLKVAPVADIVDKLPHHVPQILINKDPIDHCNFDVSLLGYCDEVISFLANKLGEDWKLPHEDYDDIRGKNGENLQIELIDAELREYAVTTKTESTPDVLEKGDVSEKNASKSESLEGNGHPGTADNELPDSDGIVDEGMKVGAVHWKDSILYTGNSVNGSSQGSEQIDAGPGVGGPRTLSQEEKTRGPASWFSANAVKTSSEDDSEGSGEFGS
ncbi:SIR2 [Candida metapsilosis]|uniref:SIR2 n=1 Tax=Candida metapsilosis TaxID=273372 RepID=A0A8H8DED8_9ASCO|nr:SIR2 [Candida metapsilosis]